MPRFHNPIGGEYTIRDIGKTADGRDFLDHDWSVQNLTARLDKLTDPSDKPAVVLLSGGLDSATVLAIARLREFSCHTLSFDYGQRHRHELVAAEQVSKAFGAISHRLVKIDLRGVGGSALTADIPVPKDRTRLEMTGDIPVTYVPARNLVFLSIATAIAEALGASDIFLGVNAVDYSGYPDCRPEFIEAFACAATLGTRVGVLGRSLSVHAPLIRMTKAEIIKEGIAAGVDYGLTHSCYDPVSDSGGFVRACGRCDSCQLRRDGFKDAGVPDPTLYSIV